MATSQVNPGTTQFPGDANKRVQRQILNDKFEKVTVVRPVDISFADSITSVEDATSYLNGDNDKLVEILRAGLISEAKRKAGDAKDGWYDKESEEIYTGVQLDGDKATALVLGLAKSAFAGIYATNPTGAKDKARVFLQSPAGSALIEGLKVSNESVTE